MGHYLTTSPFHSAHFEEAMKFARRSVSDNDIRRYEMFAQNPPAIPRIRLLQSSPKEKSRQTLRVALPRLLRVTLGFSQEADDDDLYA